MNVQPPDKPRFKGAGWVLAEQSLLRKKAKSPPLPPNRLLGEQLSPVGVGRLRLQRQRSRRGRRRGAGLGSARVHLPGEDPDPFYGTSRHRVQKVGRNGEKEAHTAKAHRRGQLLRANHTRREGAGSPEERGEVTDT